MVEVGLKPPPFAQESEALPQIPPSKPRWEITKITKDKILRKQTYELTNIKTKTIYPQHKCLGYIQESHSSHDVFEMWFKDPFNNISVMSQH